MKIIFLLSLLATACYAEFTCDDCVYAAGRLVEITTEEGSLDAQTEILMAEMCPQTPDPETCVENLPWFWPALGKVILSEHWKYICADMVCDGLPTIPPGSNFDATIQSFLPSCEECTERINISADYLGAEETIVAWVDGLVNSEWCAYIVPDNPEGCKEGVKHVLPLALPVLSSYDRTWVTDFCTEWGACSV
jgi:hypothetical protein